MSMLRSLLTLLLFTAALPAATGTRLPGSTLYPRLVRLQFGPHRGAILAKTGNRLFLSTDEGRTFAPFATVPTGGERETVATPAGPARERCCSTIYELPKPIGPLPAGTLLYAASFFVADVPAVVLFQSPDSGEHWQFLAMPLRAGDAHHGLWEPEFTISGGGSLVMFVSDETDPCCSQKLVQMRTSDGTQWSARADLVAARTQAERPGMAVVSRFANGTWFMTYEICGPAYHCGVFFRTSRDGWNFGDPADPGTRIHTAGGETLAHAPGNLVVSATGAGSATRQTIIVSGQMLLRPDGSVAPGNGRLLLTHSEGPLESAWETTPAPVEVPAAYDNYCPNYSSALLPVRAGSELLELASDYDTSHHCTSFFATRSLR